MRNPEGSKVYPTFVAQDVDFKTLSQNAHGIIVKITRSYLNASCTDPAQLIRLTATSLAPAQPGKFTTRVTLAQHCIPRAAGIDARREAVQLLLDLLYVTYPGLRLRLKYGTGF